ncbi:MAG: hypothetical protein NTY85_04415 [Actinobacteria bacterium]|nr:hypothetical protein [Actinomycetota bacterium]
MKFSKLAVLFTIAILTTSTSVITVQAAGRTAASIPNTILNGKGAPAVTLGINGDFYIDTRSLLIYGPKAKGKWPLPQNLQGPTGSAGAPGTTGTDGKNGSDGKTTAASTVSGTPGTPGATGAPGAPGANGTPGTPGATGSPGAPGSGSPGATGSPGSNGSPGTAGARGETGTAGSVGSKGETGTAGISEVKVINIAAFAISTMIPLGETTSESFGALEINSSYFFQIFLSGESLDDFYDFGARISSTGSAPTFNFAASKSKLVADVSKRIAYGVSIVGTVKTLGTITNLTINIVDVTGESGTRGGVSFSGRAYLQKVGTIL